MEKDFWINPAVEMPAKTKGSYSDYDVFICRMYRIDKGRTLNGKWVDMQNKELNDVILWAHIPEIPEKFHSLFNCT